jgi:DNA-binding transcriptional regulator YdaS (Cro superfamily)
MENLIAYLNEVKGRRTALAMFCQVNPTYVTHWCDGTMKPTPKQAADISAWSGGRISVREILYPDGMRDGARWANDTEVAP